MNNQLFYVYKIVDYSWKIAGYIALQVIGFPQIQCIYSIVKSTLFDLQMNNLTQ